MSSEACPNCAAASQREHWEFSANCIGCRARRVARSPQYFKCKKEGKQTRGYRALLQQFGLTHEQVRAAADCDAHVRKGSEASKVAQSF
jgi:hypothetical protein